YHCYLLSLFFSPLRRPPPPTLFPYTTALPISKQKILSAEIMWANIFTAVGLLNDAKAWGMICIGSDYDGVVSYLPGYPTMCEYRSEEHTSELQSRENLVCRLLLEKKKIICIT